MYATEEAAWTAELKNQLLNRNESGDGERDAQTDHSKEYSSGPDPHTQNAASWCPFTALAS